MEFIEAPIFTKHVYNYWNEDEYAAFQWHLAKYPTSGDVIPESGGLRKIRWMYGKTGKRGGVRVIYYCLNDEETIWLLTMYKKNEIEMISGIQLRKIKEALLR